MKARFSTTNFWHLYSLSPWFLTITGAKCSIWCQLLDIFSLGTFYFSTFLSSQRKRLYMDLHNIRVVRVILSSLLLHHNINRIEVDVLLIKCRSLSMNFRYTRKIRDTLLNTLRKRENHGSFLYLKLRRKLQFQAFIAFYRMKIACSMKNM